VWPPKRGGYPSERLVFNREESLKEEPPFKSLWATQEKEFARLMTTNWGKNRPETNTKPGEIKYLGIPKFIALPGQRIFSFPD